MSTWQPKDLPRARSKVLVALTRWVRLRLRAALWRQWKTPRRRRAALVALGVRGELRNMAGSGHGPWHLARSKALSVGLSNAHFKKAHLQFSRSLLFGLGFVPCSRAIPIHISRISRLLSQWSRFAEHTILSLISNNHPPLSKRCKTSPETNHILLHRVHHCNSAHGTWGS
jgi:hypothetical protein